MHGRAGATPTTICVIASHIFELRQPTGKAPVLPRLFIQVASTPGSIHLTGAAPKCQIGEGINRSPPMKRKFPRS
jgi:hypothetical protein